VRGEGLDLARDGKMGVHLDGSTVFEVSRLDVIEGPSERRRRNKAERGHVRQAGVISRMA
jgi:hypothetical protein